MDREPCIIVVVVHRHMWCVIICGCCMVVVVHRDCGVSPYVVATWLWFSCVGCHVVIGMVVVVVCHGGDGGGCVSWWWPRVHRAPSYVVCHCMWLLHGCGHALSYVGCCHVPSYVVHCHMWSL